MFREQAQGHSLPSTGSPFLPRVILFHQHSSPAVGTVLCILTVQMVQLRLRWAEVTQLVSGGAETQRLWFQVMQPLPLPLVLNVCLLWAHTVPFLGSLSSCILVLLDWGPGTPAPGGSMPSPALPSSYSPPKTSFWSLELGPPHHFSQKDVCLLPLVLPHRRLSV